MGSWSSIWWLVAYFNKHCPELRVVEYHFNIQESSLFMNPHWHHIASNFTIQKWKRRIENKVFRQRDLQEEQNNHFQTTYIDPILHKRGCGVERVGSGGSEQGWG